MPELLIRLRRAALRRHKKRQRDGLWCEPGCAFHTAAKATKEVRHTNTTWTWMYFDNVDRMAKEGAFD